MIKEVKEVEEIKEVEEGTQGAGKSAGEAWEICYDSLCRVGMVRNRKSGR